jgi:uncharacterized protein
VERPSGPSGRRRFPLRWVLPLAAVVVVAALAATWVAIASGPDRGARGAASGQDGAASGQGGGGAVTARHTYLLQAGERPATRVSLEVAADEPARERGLSGRARVPPGTGMAFLFPTDTTAPFWMKDTLVPLQIAFVAADGRVVSLFEMTPCRADPCTVYTPGAAYRYAVELPSGAFTAAGLGKGDRLVAENPESLPRAS